MLVVLSMAITAAVNQLETATFDFRATTLFRELADAFRRSGADCLGRPRRKISPRGLPRPPGHGLSAGDRRRPVVAIGPSPGFPHLRGSEGFVPAKSVAVAYRREVFYILLGPLVTSGK